MKVGFTGSRHGTTREQRTVLGAHLREIRRVFGISEFHHGGCIGADYDAHLIVSGLDHRPRIHVHYSNQRTNRARCETGPGDMIYEVKHPLIRNADIVHACDFLIATPSSMYEELRSGTWATVRLASKLKKRVQIIYPTGELRGRTGQGETY